MNFLGHAWYSDGEDDEFLAGNVFGDFIKGKIAHYSLPESISRGVAFHRYLDTVGDNCNGFKRLRELLGHDFRHYRGVIADIFIDHLLSINWSKYNSLSLEDYAIETYRRMAKSIPYFPERTTRVFEYMSRDNWFVKNRDIAEIEKTLERIENRAGNGIQISHSVEILKRKSEAFNGAFSEFMEEMIIITGRNKQA